MSDRGEVLKRVHARVRALLVAEAMPPDESSVDDTILETVALLQSLLSTRPNTRAALNGAARQLMADAGYLHADHLEVARFRADVKRGKNVSVLQSWAMQEDGRTWECDTGSVSLNWETPATAEDLAGTGQRSGTVSHSEQYCAEDPSAEGADDEALRLAAEAVLAGKVLS